MKTLSVETATNKYNVFIDKGLLLKAAPLFSDCIAGKQVLIVTDANVKPLYFNALYRHLTDAGFTVSGFVLPGGEKSKTQEQLFAIIKRLFELNFNRSDCIAALGGGTVGDVAGLAASLYMRGINFAVLPTTLLAMVDSSVGGKTAVDFEGYKNGIGTFYQPCLVICDTDTLLSLPKEETACGYAEIIKYGMIKSPDIIYEIINGTADINRLISKCISIKSEFVKTDERDIGMRHLLNFGHTFGHGVEAASGYGLPHGYCVAAGMYAITNACTKEGICAKECLDLLKKAISVCNIPISINADINEIWQAVQRDKKQTDDTVCLVVPKNLGYCKTEYFTQSEAKRLLLLGLEDML